MRLTRSSWVCIFIVVASRLGLAVPITLLEYTFPTAGGAGVEVHSSLNPTTVAVGLNPSFNMAIRDTAGTITLGTENPTPNYATQPVLRVDPDGNSSSLAQAITNNKYFVFALQPDLNYELDLLQLEFLTARGGAGTPRGWGLRSSVDGYASTIAGADITTVRATWSSVTVPLPASYFEGITGPVTFRMYVYSPADGSTIEFDNIRLIGEATLLPEPATMSLLAVGALILVRRRRK
ncbi:MAG TPA: PEP-CTERM sorting domain-containing protein [Planctomycetota bacterium]|nr:PEP-CTERM sorting domain-containing protein [Planctomycetota bacterium]HRR80086.1 PEP-CTERM sorting domain-containing protein [Planctomycetota bacterium]HRT93772.1 PEP-CTERM sorting domain-containing protein [Planctomycetota bacterium]